jgi:hypothetical protein
VGGLAFEQLFHLSHPDRQLISIGANEDEVRVWGEERQETIHILLLGGLLVRFKGSQNRCFRWCIRFHSVFLSVVSTRTLTLLKSVAPCRRIRAVAVTLSVAGSMRSNRAVVHRIEKSLLVF